MKRTLLVFVAAVLACGALLAAFAVRRVPVEHEGARVGRDGSVSVLGAGWHLVRPGGERIVVYPAGGHTLRFPADGNWRVLTADGEPLHVALSFDVEFEAGSSAALYQKFSARFEDAFARLAAASAEIEAAAGTRSADPERYLAAVTEGVRRELEPAGARVVASRLEHWDGERRAPLPGAVAVAPIPPRKVVVVGVDGADWKNLQPLIEAGRLPNFKKLVEGGATGPLRSIEPMLSPLLWTTMATGKYPEDHGILNFTVVDETTGLKIPITRYYRKVDAFWNMLGDYGRSVGVVGWLATDPAENVNGVVVTDKVGYLAYAPDDTSSLVAPGSVYPPARAAAVAALVVHRRDVTWETMRRLIHISKSEFASHRDREFDPRDPVNNLILLYASTQSFRNIALDLLKRDRPQTLAVYFEWIDAVSHLFMLQSAPRMPDVSADEFARYRDVIPMSYAVQDEILGSIMSALDDSTVLMVVSDHGFKSGDSRLKNRPEIWAGNAALWHRPDGIIALFGPGVQRGFEIREASILDVAPTLLALAGLPRAADMPGKILLTAFDAQLQGVLNSNTVPTLNRDRAGTGDIPTAGGGASAEAMKKLEALGYLTPDNADAHNNLGQRFQDRGEFLKAIEEYRKAITMRPDFHSAYNNLAVCYGKLKRFPEAEEALQKTILLKPDDFYAMNNLAVMYIETQRLDRALEMARRCVRTEPVYVNGRITLGSVLAMSGDLEGAEKEFREAQRIDPTNRTVQENLRRLEAHKKGTQ